MAKITDANGFWLIENNPISKEGVFPYLGRQISPKLEPDKIYMVYRPAEELENPETLESFNAVPFIDEHEMLGEGFTKYDDRPAGGVLFNVEGKNGILTGDMKIYSENLKDEISNGKKELSLGYLCDYDLQRGVWNGQRYDAVQRNIRGNHIALVSKGRMGADVRVYDKAITMDALDLEIPLKDGSPKECGDNSTQLNNGEKQMADKKTMDADKREAIREVMAIAAKPDSDFEGGEEEKIETIAKILEESEYAPSEADKGEDESVNELEKKEEEPKKEGSDKCSEDEELDDKRKAIREVMAIAARPASEFEGGEEEKERTIAKIMERSEYSESSRGTANDAMPRKILEMISKRNELVKAVEPMIGSFACDSMTDIDVAEYACKKLGLKASKDEAALVLRGYLAASKESSSKRVYGLDSADYIKSGIDKATEKYLKGE